MILELNFETILFLALGSITVLTAISVVLQKNPVISAISLVFTFFSLAGVYGLMGAIFIATMQVLVYAGAIMVLVVFVLMLLSQRGDQLVNFYEKPFRVLGLFFLVFSFALALSQSLLTGIPRSLEITKGVAKTDQSSAYQYPIQGDTGEIAKGNVASVGASTYLDYALPFEMISILLLIAVIGAVILAKKRLIPQEEIKDNTL